MAEAVLTLNDAIRSAVDAMVSDIHTCLPAKVEKYDYATRKASIKPLIKRPYLDGKAMPLPVITAVPVVFPWGGSASLTFPIDKGHTGLLLFSERSLDVWLAKGGDVDPADSRKFDLSDGFFIPGMAPFSQTGPAEDGNSLLLKHGLAKIRMNGGKLAIGNSGAELLDVLDQLITALISTTVTTPLGAFPLSSALSGQLATIKALLTLLKGTL